MITDVLDSEGTALVAELGDAAVYRHHDVTDETGWTATVNDVVERWGRLDVLVNNAGILKVLPMTETSLDDFESVMGVNATGGVSRDEGRGRRDEGSELGFDHQHLVGSRAPWGRQPVRLCGQQMGRSAA